MCELKPSVLYWNLFRELDDFVRDNQPQFQDFLQGQLLLPGIDYPFVLRKIQSMLRYLKDLEIVTEDIPPKWKEPVGKFRHGQLTLLRFLKTLNDCEVSLFQNILISTPALGFAISCHHHFFPEMNRDELSQLLAKKQGRIIELMKGKGFQIAGVNGLRKIFPQEISLATLTLFERVAAGNSWKKARHRKHLPKFLLYLLERRDSENHLSERFFREVDDLDHPMAEMNSLVKIAQKNSRSLGFFFLPRLKIHGLSRLRETCEKIIATGDDLDFRFHFAGRLPLPPFPGNDHIVPLTTISDFFQEGEVMRNCIVSGLPGVSGENVMHIALSFRKGRQSFS